MLVLLLDLLALKACSGLFILKSVPCPMLSVLDSEISFPKETLDALRLAQTDFPLPTKFNPRLVSVLFPMTAEPLPSVAMELFNKENNATMEPSTTITMFLMPAVPTVWLLDVVMELPIPANSVILILIAPLLARSTDDNKLLKCPLMLCGLLPTKHYGTLGVLVLETINHPFVFLLPALMLVP
jgi:hypothetical protein